MKSNRFRKGWLVGIIFLFIISAFVPMSIGYDIKVSDVKQQKPIKSSYGTPPEEEWNKTFGGISEDWGKSVQQTTDGGYIITGWTDSYGAGGVDVWLIKTDTNGNEQWNKTFGGTSTDWGRSCQQTTDGGYIITGNTYSYDAGLGDFWLIKTDTNGNEQWNKTFGGTNSDCGFSVQQTTDSGYIITGYTKSYGAGESDVWVIKTDANGTEQWNKTFGGTKEDWGRSGQQTTDGGYIITGWASSYVIGGSNVWLIKTDGNGNEQWNKTIDSNGRGDRAHSGQQTTDGGYIIIGVTWPYGTGGSNVWLIKTDAFGNEQWNKKFGGPKDDWGYSGRQTTDGGYIITGVLRSWVPGYGAGWLIKTDANGNETWNKTLDGCGFSVQQTTDSGYIIAGYAYPYGAGGSADVWLLKVAAENQPPNKPSIDGQTSGKAGKEYEYTFNAIDPDGDDVKYFIDWGDNTTGEWTDFNASATDVKVKHTWSEEGTYNITAKAQDEYGAESDWATLTVTMPRNKATSNVLLLRFLERFPILQKMLLYLIK